MVRAILRGVYVASAIFSSGIMNSSGDDRLKDLEKRLDTSLSQRKGVAPDTTEGSAAGLAMRAVTELFVGLAVCMGLGWMIDKYFGTAPWVMLALMPFGIAAGVVNVMRLSKSKQAEDVLGSKGPVAPSVKDDDED
jgi:ATP synthase protein I